MKINLRYFIPVIASLIFMSAVVLADITPGNNSPCTWDIITNSTIELSYGYPTQTTMTNNVLVINFITLDIVERSSLQIPIIENELDVNGKQLSEELLLVRKLSGGSCTWTEREIPHLSAGSLNSDMNVLITKVIINRDYQFDFESRIWRNQARLDNEDTLTPAAITPGGLG